MLLLLPQLLCLTSAMERSPHSHVLGASAGGGGIGGAQVGTKRAENMMRTEGHQASHHGHRAQAHAAARSHSNGGDSHVSVHMLDSGHLHLLKDRPEAAAPSHHATLPAHASGHAQRRPPVPHQKQMPRRGHHGGNFIHHSKFVEPPASLAHKEDFNPLAAAKKLFSPEKAVSSQSSGDGSVEKSDGNGDANDGFQEGDDMWRGNVPSKDRGYAWKQDHDSRDETNDDDWDDEDSNYKGTVEDPTDGDGDGDTSDAYGDGDGENSTGTYGSDGEAYDGADMPMVNVTAEEDASAAPNSGPLKAKDPNVPAVPPPETQVEKLGEGIGAMAYERSPTGSRVINHDLRQRLQLQDYATIYLLLSVFALTVLLSCCSVYQVADDPSPAAYYSEPKNYQPRVICESKDVDAFLAAFNTQPQNVRLRIIGRNPEPGGFRRFLRTLNAHTTRPRGLAALLPMRQRRRLSVLFDVALDLTPFITGDGRLSDENLLILQQYLNSKNRLETVLIQKKVDWVLWEDVATNIRQRLRTLGFPGEVEVRFEAQDEVLVYQNHKWSNFVRNRVTQALVVISIIGSAFWLPYVMVRSKTTKVETRFRINVDPSRYWELVSDGLSAAEGFQSI